MMSPQERSKHYDRRESAAAAEGDYEHAAELSVESRLEKWRRLEEQGWPLGKPSPGSLRLMLKKDGIL